MFAATDTMITAGMTEILLGSGRMARRSLLPVAAAEPRATWSSGDYSIVGARLQIVAERLRAALDLQPGQRVLDLGAGNGNLAVSAGRGGCQVSSVAPSEMTRHIEALLNRSKESVTAEQLDVEFLRADGASLPFEDNHFDVVTSDFGVMFAADQGRAAEEMLRVCRPGGRIGLASWTPESFMGRLFDTIGKHAPEQTGTTSFFRWGTKEYVSERFDAESSSIDINQHTFTLHYKTPQHWLDLWRTHYVPLRKAFESLDGKARDQLAVDLLALIDRCNVATDGSVTLRANYLEVVARMR